MNSRNYAIHKVKYKFRTNPIFDIFNKKQEEEEEQKEEEEVQLNSEDEVQEAVPQESEEYLDLFEKFEDLRPNANRRMERLIKRNKSKINKLTDDEKNQLLNYISNKFYGKDLK